MTDATTGLPELPEGYFWRVRPGSLHMDKLELRKRVWFFSILQDSRVLHYYTDTQRVLDPRDEILRAARKILKEFVNPWEAFYGDYPPKRLEEQ